MFVHVIKITTLQSQSVIALQTGTAMISFIYCDINTRITAILENLALC